MHFLKRAQLLLSTGSAKKSYLLFLLFLESVYWLGCLFWLLLLLSLAWEEELEELWEELLELELLLLELRSFIA